MESIGCFVPGNAAANPVPGLRANERVAHWSRDERHVLVYDPTRIPTPIERVDLATGTRTPFALFTPEDPTEITSIENVRLP